MEENTGRNSDKVSSKKNIGMPGGGWGHEDWLPLVDTFRTFYFSEITNIKDKLEVIKGSFAFI